MNNLSYWVEQLAERDRLLTKAHAKIAVLLAERRRIKAVLEFYADETHWDDDGICWIPPEWSEADFPIIAGSQDRGAFAAAVLKGGKP